MHAQRSLSLSEPRAVTVGGLVVAAAGVVIQIVSDPDRYPTIPPVFFLLLLPAALVAFGRWRWTPLSAVLVGLFLTFGLFPSGAWARLFNTQNLGDTAGLWIQTIAVAVATIAAIVATGPLVRQAEGVTMAKTVSKVVGVAYVVIGVAGLILAEDVQRNHNLLHFFTGLFALYFGFFASVSWAKNFCLAIGAAYLAFAVLGLVLGDPTMDRAWNVGLMIVGRDDHVHHLVLSMIILGGGILTTVSSSRTRSASMGGQLAPGRSE